MKYVIMVFVALLHLNVLGQPNAYKNRFAEIEKSMSKVNSVKDFKKVAYSMKMTVRELSYYPIISPVKDPVISSGFGMRKHPIYKVRKMHTGIDLPKVKGTPVYAAGNGIVTRKGFDSGYGLFVEIRHAGGFRTLYAHLSKALVNKGESVSIGKQIACVGNSGTSTGYHL
ncbi:MAG: M23 family metallopeptidase, partial [Tannerellaceae bacterium]|nr:M23 family metallopeptidase [Tannerellaceae bacterium]